MSETNRTKASAGLPDEESDRIAELEARLMRLEGGPSLRARGRRMLDAVMPQEASHHFFNAGREHLLGMRAMVDFWLRRIDDMEERTTSEPARESIEID